MKIVKNNGRYYVNDLDLKEVLSNRKYVSNYIKDSIEQYTQLLRDNPDIERCTLYKWKGRLKAYKEVQEKMRLRR
jgi:hypothetical protein